MERRDLLKAALVGGVLIFSPKFGRFYRELPRRVVVEGDSQWSVEVEWYSETTRSWSAPKTLTVYQGDQTTIPVMSGVSLVRARSVALGYKPSGWITSPESWSPTKSRLISDRFRFGSISIKKPG